jgi:hypothetical protein
MTLAIYTRATECMQDPATAALEEAYFLIRLLTRLRKGASAPPSNLYIFPLFAGLFRVAGPGFEPGTP